MAGAAEAEKHLQALCERFVTLFAHLGPIECSAT